MKIPSNKVQSIINYFQSELRELYDKDEIENFIFYAFEEYLNFSRIDLHLKAGTTVNESDLLKFNQVVKRLKQQEPIQYILGSTEFYRLKIKVSPQVLIPRPETEELVDVVIKNTRHLVLERHANQRKPFTILDIGTGSGCIAIALKKNLPEANVYALDISAEALAIAEENAIRNEAEIQLINLDIFDKEVTNNLAMFDLIISNPPYVRFSEKEAMSKNVLDHEPHLALFVKDEDPLLFYHTIADLALTKLNKGGSLYFEINEFFGEQLAQMLLEKGFKNTVLKKDIRSKNRILYAVI